MRSWTTAQIAALAFGLWWVGNGAAVFFLAEPSIGSLEGQGAVSAFGTTIAVNGWHGLFHLVTGAAGMTVCSSTRGSRAYALAIGMVYLAAAFSSLVTGETVFGLIRVDGFGSLDHAMEGVVLLLAWVASSTRSQEMDPVPG
jgi:Domain of unknown function (DUF4383)